MAKKPLPLRIDEDLLKRVDDRRRVLGQTRTLFVERALESALSQSGAGTSMPPREDPSDGPVGRAAPTRASVKKAEVALEVRDAVQKRNTEKTYSCPKAGCIYVSDSPGVCVHHRTERLR